MRAFSALSTAFLFAVSTWALTVTNPAQGSSWDASKQAQTVGWNTVTTDPTNFTISLVNMVRSRSASVTSILSMCFPHYPRTSRHQLPVSTLF